MNITKAAAITGGIMLGALTGAAFQFSAVSAAVPAGGHSSVAVSAPVARPTASPSPSPSCLPMKLAIAFTDNVTDTSGLHLHLPWGRPGDPEGQMVEDYGAYNGTTIRKHLPVHDVTTGSLVEMYGHNEIYIVLVRPRARVRRAERSVRRCGRAHRQVRWRSRRPGRGLQRHGQRPLRADRI